MISRKLVRHRPPHAHKHRHRASPNLVSGIIYSIAAISCVAMGLIFARHVYRVQQTGIRSPLDSSAEESVLPAHVKVIAPRKDKAISFFVPPRQSAPTSQILSAAAPQRAPISTEPELSTAPAPQSDSAPASIPSEAERFAGFSSSAPAWKPTLDSFIPLETMRLSPTADTAILIPPKSGMAINAGAETNLPLRGNEAFVLARYDTTPVRGWTIVQASWIAHVTKKDPPPQFGFTAITTPWQEGSGLLNAPAQNGATFEWAEFQKTRWRKDGLSFPYVIRGNHGSRFCIGTLLNAHSTSGGYTRFEIDPAIVQSLIAGTASGLVISDEHGQRGETWYIPSRETERAGHYLEVTGARGDFLPPGQPRELRAQELEELRRAKSVGVRLSWVAPGDDDFRGHAFAYRIRYAPAPCTYQTAQELSPDLAPYPRLPGQPERILLDGLLPETMYTFYVAALDEIGQMGPVAEVTLETGKPALLPTPSPMTFRKGGAIQLLSGAYLLEIRDELRLPSPFVPTETPRTEVATERGESDSLIWDRNARMIRLRAARNETIGFLLQLSPRQRDVPPIRMAIAPFQSAQKSFSSPAYFHRVWYARTESRKAYPHPWRGDALIPLENGVLDARRPDNRIPQQTRTEVYAECTIPETVEPGMYFSRLDFAGASEDSVNIALEVLPITLPAQRPFIIELVADPPPTSWYGAKAGDTKAAELHDACVDLARAHGCALSWLPRKDGQVLPRVQGQNDELTVLSWADWDALYQPVHVAGSGHIILPVSADWPTPFRDAVQCPEKVISTFDRHRVFLGSLESLADCVALEYWMTFRTALRLFREHIQPAARSGISYHCWLTGQTRWDGRIEFPPFGGPNFSTDFNMLELLVRATHSELQQWPDTAPLLLRVSSTNPAALALGHLEPFHLLCLEDSSPTVWKLVRERLRGTRTALWRQSAPPPLEEGPAGVVDRIVRDFLTGATGWSIKGGLGQPDDWTRAADRSILYCGAPLKARGALPSLRLKALRRAMQDVQYLRLLQGKTGWSREQLADFLQEVAPTLADPTRALSARELEIIRATVQNQLLK